ncbi:bifunctional molybdenum cofactor biosynthesis protein MoaC/MoaB [Rhodohalobacter sp.]|uniref:bifunctional molybdenum cofactor biosynthesis protein MoaC/MoaB n=1 Tax=Rhodohalobacter sp. TaxID=1974210 RepID=UPI002ACD7035|nr:bifunctional molybdenum cofactor biosynthesis protein MoaC/MoaB [Rhodohalobacter sp.]MDZ7756827.1 bifunctional molybdenum cofactor biosynthesis protein MoaC/MoaB [Rhodohalobacter sp.]
MIDVSHKHNTLRYARAEGVLTTTPKAIQMIRNKDIPKGDMLQVARAAGIQAAKRTSEWIVFCHSLPLDWVDLSFKMVDSEAKIYVTAETRTVWKTGLEMEAITAVSAALLNMYDMLKPLDEKAEIGMIRLVEKSGGKSDYTDSFSEKPKAMLLHVSDAVANGDKKDKVSKIVGSFLEERGLEIISSDVIPEDAEKLESKLLDVADNQQAHFIFTMGSTGPAAKDITPEATRNVIDREIPGLAEGMREHGRQRTPYAMISRGVCGVRNNTVIINLPGSRRGAEESLNALFPGLEHILKSIGKGKLPT